MSSKLKMSNETTYTGQKAYVEIDTELFKKNGEVKITSIPIIADEAVTKVERSGFEITYLVYFSGLFEILGGSKYKVFEYILKNKEYNNTLIITNRELAIRTGTAVRTVVETLKLLRDRGLIKTRVGSIMLLPKLSLRGSHRTEVYLMHKFEAFGAMPKKKPNQEYDPYEEEEQDFDPFPDNPFEDIPDYRE